VPTISIIIPAYNAAATLSATLQSVFQQTWTDFEVIVVDDGSDDATLAIARQFTDPRLKIIAQANCGAAASRNRGFAESTGEYIAFLDADDLWSPDKLAAQLRALKENPAAAVAYSWTDWIDEHGERLRRGGYHHFSGDVRGPLLTVNLLENGSNPLIRREAIAAIGGFDPALRASQDWDFYLRLAAHYSFVNVPQVHVFYRVLPGSISANLERLEATSRLAIARALDIFPAEFQSFQAASLSNLYIYLTFRALAAATSRERLRPVARYWWQAARYCPQLWRAKVSLRLWLVLAARSLEPQLRWLPPRWRYSRFLTHFDALLGYIRVGMAGDRQPHHLDRDQG